jgi:hypothetical protein
MASIVVSGCLLRRPSSMAARGCLEYLLALAMLDADVLYVEGSRWPHTCSREPPSPAPRVPRTSLMHLRATLRGHRADMSVVWVDEDAGLVEGMVWPQLRRRVAQADVLLDIGGACMLGERAHAQRRAFIAVGRSAEHAASSPWADYDVCFSYAVSTAWSRQKVASESAHVVLERVLEDVPPRRLRRAA